MMAGALMLAGAALLGLAIAARSVRTAGTSAGAPAPPARWWEEDGALPSPMSQEWLTEHDYDRGGDRDW